MTSPRAIPPEIQSMADAALRALGPVKAADITTQAEMNFLHVAKRTDAGQQLPPYYLVYFLLVDLLGFKNLGRFEKVAWSIPIDYQGRAFLIEHRKLGFGLFAHDPEHEEAAALDIVSRIQKAVRVARPFFDWMAEQAVAESTVNVVNNSYALFERYTYLRDVHKSKAEEAELRKDERIVDEHESASGRKVQSIWFPALRLRTEADWVAMAAIEAFFSWTEHVLIHIAVLFGCAKTAEKVASLAKDDWSVKFRSALDLTDAETKKAYDSLLAIRRDLRNYIAHGAFGKQGEAFMFHSTAGAVPVLLPHQADSKKFIFGHGLAFDSEAALHTIEQFISFLWSGTRSAAQIYIQESHLPIILTMAADGTYASAMESDNAMKELVERLSSQSDRAANMDW